MDKIIEKGWNSFGGKEKLIFSVSKCDDDKLVGDTQAVSSLFFLFRCHIDLSMHSLVGKYTSHLFISAQNP